MLQQYLPFTVLKHFKKIFPKSVTGTYLPFTVCAEGYETAEEQSDDEAHTLQVPERREGKTRVLKQQYLPFTVLKLATFTRKVHIIYCGCNSTYRSRYAPKGARQQRRKATMRPAHLLPELREGKTKVIKQ